MTALPQVSAGWLEQKDRIKCVSARAIVTVTFGGATTPLSS
ncbi:hypothetical protein NB311A_20031 [Nitrobacter sp. Nb-311A]|nr:hypothetical protein NB311A_20031 [Nitrobacter sp. Nb-311A]